MAGASRRSSGTIIQSTFQRSISPSGRLSVAAASMTSTPLAAPSAFFSSPFLGRSASPTGIKLFGGGSPHRTGSSVHFALPAQSHRPVSPNRFLAVTGSRRVAGPAAGSKRTCMCSPTTHPGSLRCSLHKGFGRQRHPHPAAPNRLNVRRSAMTNSLVRIATVEGDLVKRALATMIRPSSHQQRRRADFQPRPSRLSVMSKADVA